MRTAILIPVKELRQSKQRLTTEFTPAARQALAAQMMLDVFDAVAQARGADAVFVATSDVQAIEEARARGWQILLEIVQVSESDSVDRASRELHDRGFAALLRLPIDIPLVQPQDIEELFAAATLERDCVIVPSRDGTGTNALLRTPPALFPSHFGPESFRKHRAEAEACGAAFRVLRNPRVELDLDDSADLRAFLSASNGATRTGKWLYEHWHSVAAVQSEERILRRGHRGAESTEKTDEE